MCCFEKVPGDGLRFRSKGRRHTVMTQRTEQPQTTAFILIICRTRRRSQETGRSAPRLRLVFRFPHQRTRRAANIFPHAPQVSVRPLIPLCALVSDHIEPPHAHAQATGSFRGSSAPVPTRVWPPAPIPPRRCHLSVRYVFSAVMSCRFISFPERSSTERPLQVLVSRDLI